MSLNECKAEPMPVQEPELLQLIIRLEDSVRVAKDIRQDIIINIDKLKPINFERPIEQKPSNPGYLGHILYVLTQIEEGNNELREIKNHLQEII